MRRRTSRRSAPEPAAVAAPRAATVRIERIGADGDGIADGPVYIPFTLPGELVRARVTGQRGALDAVLEPSPDRVDPPCPHFGACGGCALQHWRADAALAWKAGQLVAALGRAGYADVPFAEATQSPPRTRRRVGLALQRKGGRAAVGLHRLRSGEVIDLETCLVLHPSLFALVAPLRGLLATTGMLRREGSAVLNLLDTGPDLLLRTDAEPDVADRAAIVGFARAHGVPRIVWGKDKGEPETIAMLSPATITLAGVTVTPPPGGFLQASAAGERAIVDAVIAGLPTRRVAKSRIVELFAGCGTLTFALAREARTIAYEGDPQAVTAVRRAMNAAGLQGRVEPVQRDLAHQPLMPREMAGSLAVVLDPPFAGAAAQMPAIATARPEAVVYVSCNPAALARDARVLQEAGYALTRVTLVDQFLWSARIEAVCVFGIARGGRG